MDTVTAASLAKCCHVTNEHMETLRQNEVRNITFVVCNGDRVMSKGVQYKAAVSFIH